MKFKLLLLLSCFALNGFAQKYALIDKKMSQPVTYTNAITLQQSAQGVFAVEKDKLRPFLAEVDKIVKYLEAKKIPDSFNFNIGATNFRGLQIPLKEEVRLDVVLSTETPDGRLTMHLCDAKNSNAANAYYISTWAKYIRGGLPK
jgi:hypothetical protein